MLGRSINNASSGKNKNNLDTSSEMNSSVAALPEDSSSVAAANGGDTLRVLEDSDDDTLGNANKSDRVTSV